jgi:hypothetical protein
VRVLHPLCFVNSKVMFRYVLGLSRNRQAPTFAGCPPVIT